MPSFGDHISTRLKLLLSSPSLLLDALAMPTVVQQSKCLMNTLVDGLREESVEITRFGRAIGRQVSTDVCYCQVIGCDTVTSLSCLYEPVFRLFSVLQILVPTAEVVLT